MNFAGALFALERGHKVKRHHWTGYWFLGERKVDDGEYVHTIGTVMMHCYDGKDVDIRDTDEILYTLSNCACDDWEIVED